MGLIYEIDDPEREATFQIAIFEKKKPIHQQHQISKSLCRNLGHVAVYAGEQVEKKRFVVPISYLNHPLFRDFLRCTEEEFGFNHPMGGLTIPCREETFCSPSP